VFITEVQETPDARYPRAGLAGIATVSVGPGNSHPRRFYVIGRVYDLPMATRVQYLRRDTSGILTSRLTAALEEGELLGELLSREAQLCGDTTTDLEFHRSHRLWVLRCLPVLAEGFEPESVAEFVHVSKCVTQAPRPASLSSAAALAMRDALELLRGLRATLHRDDRG